MGLVPSRWLVLLLAAVVAFPLFAIAQDDAVVYDEAPKTVCWSCHQTPQKKFPKLTDFFAVLPPAQAGSPPGTPFDYIVQVQNTWGADMPFWRPTLDLTAAPSLAFVSDLDDLDIPLDGAIAIDITRPTEAQFTDQTVPVPFGYSKGQVVVTPTDNSPATGPFLTLKIWGGEAVGDPKVIETGGRGEAVVHQLATRDDFDHVGYGNWTIRIETTLIPPGSSNITLPPSPVENEVAYHLDVHAEAEAILDRKLSLPSNERILPGDARAVTFSLIALSEPGAGETVALWVDAMVDYKHVSAVNPCCDNTTRAFSPDIKVEPGVSLVAEVDPDSIIVSPGVQNGATMGTISEVVGYAAAFLLISSVWTGGMFGKASRRQLNTVFGSAKRRVAFHNFLSYGILLAASIHTVLFIVETAFYWTVGVIWGGLAILSMFGLGLTGAFQVQMIRKWSYGFWRWTHYGMAVAAIVFTLVHGALDGVHFDAVQDAVGWKDPLDPRNVQA